MFPYNCGQGESVREFYEEATAPPPKIKHPRIVCEIVQCMDDWFGILLTPAQGDAIIQWCPALEADLLENGLDTSSREWFLSEVTKRIGIKVAWPTGGDSDAYALAFYELFRKQAIANGLRLTATFVGDKFPGADFVPRMKG